MAELDYDALQRLADVATPGPWGWTRDPGDEEGSLESPEGAGYVLSASGMHTEGFIYVSADDAEFIAASRSAVPALLDRVRELEAERDAALSTIAKVEAIHQKTYVNRHFRGFACSTCVDPYEDRAMKWPCPTIRALGSVPSTGEGNDGDD